jgi:phosphoglycolate phosphatase-like HAD superfamily hydrolase
LVLQAVIDSPWVPGVREYLVSHHGRQHFVLITATPQEEIEQILRTLDLTVCFRAVYGAPMPKATAIGDVLAKLSSPAQQALVVGDSQTDLEAAQTNGVPFLLRRTSLNHELQARHPVPAFDGLNHE